MQSHRYEELLPEEFYAELERAPVAYFACGAMEEHGLHNPLGTDFVQCYEMALRAAEITGGIVFPPVPFAPAGIPGHTREELRSGTLQLFAPSLWISREACELLYTELLESLADLGFKVCMALGGHWPADLLLRDIDRKHGGEIRGMRFWGGGTVSLLEDNWLADLEACDPLAGGHGTLWETSLIMALRPEWVDLERFRRIDESPLPSQLKGGGERNARIAEASVEMGEEVLAAALKSLVAKVDGTLASALSC